MQKARGVLFVVFILVAAFVATGLAAQSSALEVVSSSVVDGRLTITGHNLSGAGVMVGGQAVNVSSISDTEIVADLSALAPGLYSVRVSRDGGASAEGTKDFSVIIQ